MSLKLNKPKDYKGQGISTVQLNDVVALNSNIQFNNDRFDENGDPKQPTLSVTVLFFENQATLDQYLSDKGSVNPFEKSNFTVDEMANLDNQVNTELKKLADFDQAT